MRNTVLLLLSFVIMSTYCTKQVTSPSPLVISLSIPQDSVVLNPYKTAPLSAIIKYSSPVPGKTKIIIKGKNGASSDISQLFNDRGFHHSIPVIGLHANYTDSVVVVLVDTNGIDLAQTTVPIKTGTLPDKLPTSITPSGQLDKIENGVNLVSTLCAANPNIPLMVDKYGDVRWYLDYSGDSALKTLSYDCGISRLANGNFCFGDKTAPNLYEVDMMGKVIHTWALPGYKFHHNLQEKPDGNFLATVSKNGSVHTHPVDGPTNEDYVVEVDRTTGSIVNEWDLKLSLDEYRCAMGDDTSTADWFHGNAVIYDPSDNTIIVSGRMQGVVKLTYDNKVKWILAPHRGWGVNLRGDTLTKYLLAPLDAQGKSITDSEVVDGSKIHADFEWNWFQHSQTIMPNGDILLFDNGSTRNFNFADTILRYSRAVEYRIDAKAMTVQQIWAYGKERQNATFSTIISSVQYLPTTKHILFCPGYQVPNAAGKGGKIVEIDYASKAVVAETEVTTQSGMAFHRAKRMSLYPSEVMNGY